MKTYAPFFEWPDRPRKELGVVELLIAEVSLGWRSPRVQQPDPPDCVCLNAHGEMVGIEVAELVSSKAAALTARGQNVARRWAKGDLAIHLRQLLHSKDSKTYHGGPYKELAACLYTDEPLLVDTEARVELRSEVFGPFQQLTHAFLLFSYRPQSQGYPVIQLQVEHAT